MKTIFYNDPALSSWTPRSIFLAGPTSRDVIRSPWRQEAVDMLSLLRPEGLVILPEFRDRKFDRAFFEAQPPEAHTSGDVLGLLPGMKHSSQVILNWETACIDHANVLLVWMPFCDETPGKTTRCEVSRAIAQHTALQMAPQLVLGIPEGADTTGHIRYHAAQAGIRIHSTLRDCCIDAAHRTRYYGDAEVPAQ